jgi:hypothetical protein
MATLAIDPATPLELRIKLHRELAQYVAPRRKAADPPVVLELPPLNGSQDAVAASAALIAAVASGEIAPGEAHDIGRLLEVHLKAVEQHEIQARLAALESKQP